MGNITMKSIFSAKETISIEFSKTASDIIKKCKQKMATNHFAVFLNKKPLQNDKLIYEYNIDSKSLVEFCYFKSMDYIKEMSRLSNLHNIILYQATYQYESIDKPILLKGYNKSIMEIEYDNDLSRILREELEIFQITKSHPRFMQLFDIYMNNEWIYIGMENSTKIPMKIFLSNNNDVSAYLMSKWAYQILEGLKHLHNHNIIMKDMNPMDMWIDGNHDVKLPSFNMTEYLNHLNDDESDKYKHKDGILAYVAPEILESKPYEASVDVWSLGAVMIEVLKGAQLFPGLNESEAVRIIKEFHTIQYDKTNKPEDLITFIDFCVKGDPKERATIDDLIKMEFIEKYLS